MEFQRGIWDEFERVRGGSEGGPKIIQRGYLGGNSQGNLRRGLNRDLEKIQKELKRENKRDPRWIRRGNLGGEIQEGFEMTVK